MRRLANVDGVAARSSMVVAGLVVALAGTLLAVKLNVWIDEAFTLETTGSGPALAWARSIAFEAQPPLYFVLEALWRLLDESSIAFARLPSVLYAALAAAVVVDAAHRIAPRFPPALAALATAGNPLFIWAAAEMRVYALVLLIGAVLTALFFEAFLQPVPSRRAGFGYAAVALLGLYVQYYIGFVLVAQCLTLLLIRRSMLRSFVVLITIAGVGFAPFLGIALGHVSQSGSFVARATPWGAIHEVANVVFAFVLPHDINWTGGVKLVGFVLAAVLAAFVALYGRPGVDASDPRRGVVVQWLLCIAVFMLLFCVSGVPLNPLRHLVVLAPATLIAAIVFLTATSRFQARVIAVAALVFALFAATDLYATYKPPLANLGDWQRVATLLALARASDPSVPIAVFPAEAALPLAVYLKTRVIPVPIPVPLRIDYVRATTLTGEAQTASVLDPVRARSRHLWLVTTAACTLGAVAAYNYNCRYLEAYLAKNYRLRDSAAFYGSLVRLYDRRSPSAANLPMVDEHAE